MDGPKASVLSSAGSKSLLSSSSSKLPLISPNNPASSSLKKEYPLQNQALEKENELNTMLLIGSTSATSVYLPGSKEKKEIEEVNHITNAIPLPTSTSTSTSTSSINSTINPHPPPPARPADLLQTKLDEITSKVSEIRSKRTTLARKLNEMRITGAAKGDKKQQLENSLFILQKKKAFDGILKRRLEQLELDKSIQEIEYKQALVLAKISLYEEEVDMRANAKKTEELELRKDEWISDKKFGPVLTQLNQMGDGGDTSGVVNHMLESIEVDDDNINKELTKILTESLPRVHQRKVKSLSTDRQHLFNERLILTNQLDHIRSKTSSEESWLQKEKEAIDNLMTGLTFIEEDILPKRNTAASVMADMETEQAFLKDEPTTALWHEMDGRFQEIITSKDVRNVENETLGFFFKSREEQSELLFKEKYEEIKDEVILNLAHDIFEDVLIALVKFTVKENMAIVKTLRSNLHMTLIKGILGNNQRATQLPDPSGKFFLYKGNFMDISFDERRKAKVKAREIEQGHINVGDEAMVLLSQALASCYDTQPTPFKEVAINYDKEIAMDDILHSFEDISGRNELVAIENSYFSAVSLQAASQDPYIKFNRNDPPTIVRVFSRTLLQLSLVAVGLASGKVEIYSVLWGIITPPKLCAFTPPVPKKKKNGKITDMREGSGGAYLATLTTTGVLQLWSYASQERISKKKHPSSMFPEHPSDFSVKTPMTCIYTMDPWALSVPNLTAILSSDNSNKNESAQKKNKMAQRQLSETQKGHEVTSFCFHGSMTMLGRQPSVMLGTSGGQLFKLNLDRFVENFDAPLYVLKPFVQLEYQNPKFQDETTRQNLLILGRDTALGNKVEKEIFHFHRDPIVFLEMLALKGNSGRIISVDEKGVVALWNYDKEYFNGQCRFVPEKTAEISVILSSYEEVKPTEVLDSEPPITLLSKMQKWRVSVRDTEIERVQIHTFIPIDEFTIGSSSSTSSVLSQYSVREVEPRETTGGVAHSDVVSVQWYRKLVKRVDSSAQLFKVCLSPDGEDIVVVMQEKKNTLVLVTMLVLDIENLEPHLPFATINLQASDIIRSVVIGPVIRETLTRFAFLTTASGILHVVSLDTGSEVKVDAFGGKKVLTTDMSSVSICNQQHIFAACSEKECQVLVGAFRGFAQDVASPKSGKSGGKRIDPPPTIQPLSTVTYNALRRPLNIQLKLATDAFNFSAALHVEDEGKSSYVNPAEKRVDQHFAKYETKKVCTEIILDIINSDMWNDVNKLRVGDWRRSLLVDVYGSGTELGVVPPTTWPSSERKETQLLAREAESEELESLLAIDEDIFPLGDFQAILDTNLVEKDGDVWKLPALTDALGVPLGIDEEAAQIQLLSMKKAQDAEQAARKEKASKRRENFEKKIMMKSPRTNTTAK